MTYPDSIIYYRKRFGRKAIINVLFVSFLFVYPAAHSSETDARILYDDFESEYYEFRRIMEKDDPVDRETARRIWSRADLPPEPYYDFPLMNGDSWDRAYFRRAIGQYRKSVELIDEMKNVMERLKLRSPSISPGYLWEIQEENDAILRKRKRLAAQYQGRLLDIFNGIFESLSNIRNHDMRNHREFVNLRRSAYRNFVIYSVALRNFIPALEILEKYEKTPGANQEWPTHYYFTICLGHVFRSAQKNTGISDAELRRIRTRKNLYFLYTVELLHGRDSDEYTHALRKVKLDELGAPRN